MSLLVLKGKGKYRSPILVQEKYKSTPVFIFIGSEELDTHLLLAEEKHD